MCAAGPPRRSFTHDETISQCASLRLCPDFHDRAVPRIRRHRRICSIPLRRSSSTAIPAARRSPRRSRRRARRRTVPPQRRIPPPGTVQLVLCGFVPAVLVCGALLIEPGVLQSGIIQPGVVPEFFFQPADLFQALRQQQRDGSFGRDAGSLVLLSGPLVDDQAEVPVGV